MRGSVVPCISNLEVFINIYDLNKDWPTANSVGANLFHVGGAFHAAVEVYGALEPKSEVALEDFAFIQTIGQGLLFSVPSEKQSQSEAKSSFGACGKDWNGPMAARGLSGESRDAMMPLECD